MDDAWVNVCIDGWLDGRWIDGWTERWRNGWMGEWMHGIMNMTIHIELCIFNKNSLMSGAATLYIGHAPTPFYTF